MSPARPTARPRLWRLGTVVPTVALAIASVAVAATMHSPSLNAAPQIKPASMADGSPIGELAPLGAAPGGVRATGWALDPNAMTRPVQLDSTVDGRYVNSATTLTNPARPGVPQASAAGRYGFALTVPVPQGTHKICIIARNVGRGADFTLGCSSQTFAYGPVGHLDQAGQIAGTLRLSGWAFDNDSPTTPLQLSVRIDSGPAHTITAAGVRPDVAKAYPRAGAKHGFDQAFAVGDGTHRVCVTARNIGAYGSDTSLGCRAVTPTTSGPAPQRTPAPISTSRYIRNVRGSSPAELSLMRAEGAADARANPAGHRYLILLDIGGQNQYYGGVVLSATTRFVSYTDLVRDIQAYVSGYHSAQRSTAPVTIAIGTNNDMDVNATTGKAWAVSVINPLLSYARSYAGITIAGANDIEPGFSASYGATTTWLRGYLAATTADFIFNGSADGCAWTVSNRGCNNGWTMSGLYNLAAGAAPTRTINLPQVYNYTMADQWKYISLTGVGNGRPRINFGGPLTEYTACAQAGSCASIGGNLAWARMWSDLQSTPILRVTSLPYSTDLRIDQ